MSPYLTSFVNGAQPTGVPRGVSSNAPLWPPSYWPWAPVRGSRWSGRGGASAGARTLRGPLSC